MPKRKRKDREKRYKLPLPGPQECEDDSEVDEEDLNLLQDGLLEGRFDFLTKLEPEKFTGKGKKPIQPQPQPQTATSEDDDSDTDPDIQERQQPWKQKRGKEGSESGEEEAEFEARPRLSHWDEEEGEGLHYLLPLKTKRGLVQQPAVFRPAEEEESWEEEELSEEGGAEEKGQLEAQIEGMVVGVSPTVLTTAALFARRQQRLAEKKQTIAESASMLVESPEENISHLRRLQVLCSERDPDVAISTRKLAMLSLMAVFRDIAPSYRIREPTEAEKAVKVSKDVRRLRQFEEALLSSYQQFLTLLNETVRAGLDVGGERGCGDPPRSKRRKRQKQPLAELEDDQRLSQASMESLAEVALQCLCELAVSLSHFNYRNNTLSVLVSRMTSRALGGKVSQMCCGAIQKLFQADIVGEVSLEAVQLIARMVKAGGYKAKPAVLRTFLRLNLQQVDIPVGATGTTTGSRGPTSTTGKDPGKLKAGRMSRRQKKRLKSEAKLDRELQAAEAEESKEKKRKVQTEVIQLVFLTYFRILKHSRHSPLLQPVLEGLAKFSHLINIDFFQDLMSVLHSLAETGGLSSRECMQCVLTAFQILSGQGAALNIDPRHFYIQLYEALLQLDACSSTDDVKLAVQCLDQMMRKRRQVSLQRVLGFVKRLCTISLQLAPGACLAVMATVKQFMHAYSQCDQLLETEGVEGGVFQAEVPDPEMSQASSTLLWELCLFGRHYDPSQQMYAGHLLAGAPSQGRGTLHPSLTRKSPCELMKDFSGLKVNPMQGIPPPGPHPAMKLAQKKDHSEFYYSDPGIKLDAIKRSEAVAKEYANRVLLSLTSQQETLM